MTRTHVVLRHARWVASQLLLSESARVAVMAGRAGPGRPSKGDRHLFATRTPRPLADVIRRRADEAGLTLSDYIASVLATAHDMPEFVHAPHPQTLSEELPLSRSA